METTIQQNDLRRFDIKTEAKVIKALSGILIQSSAPYSEDEAITKPIFCTIDPTNCMMVIAISEEAKRTLSRFIDKDTGREDKIFKIPELSYLVETSLSGVPITCKYSGTLMTAIFKIFAAFEQTLSESRRNSRGHECSTIKISMKQDYPMTLENDHFKVIVAPRVAND